MPRMSLSTLKELVGRWPEPVSRPPPCLLRQTPRLYQPQYFTGTSTRWFCMMEVGMPSVRLASLQTIRMTTITQCNTTRSSGPHQQGLPERSPRSSREPTTPISASCGRLGGWMRSGRPRARPPILANETLAIAGTQPMVTPNRSVFDTKGDQDLKAGAIVYGQPGGMKENPLTL